MTATISTFRLHPAHVVAVVVLLLHVLLPRGLPEARPPGAGLELRGGVEELRAADHACIDPFLMVSTYSPVKGISVPLFTQTSCCSGVSFALSLATSSFLSM